MRCAGLIGQEQGLLLLTVSYFDISFHYIPCDNLFHTLMTEFLCLFAQLSVLGVATMCFKFVQFTAKPKGVEGGRRHRGGE